MKSVSDKKSLQSLSFIERARLTGIASGDIEFFDSMDEATRSQFNLESVFSILSDLVNLNQRQYEVKNVPLIRDDFPSYRELLDQRRTAIFLLGSFLYALTDEDGNLKGSSFETRAMSKEEVEEIIFNMLNENRISFEPTLTHLMGISEWLVRHTLFVKLVLNDEKFFKKFFSEEAVDVETIRRMLVFTLYNCRIKAIKAD